MLSFHLFRLLPGLSRLSTYLICASEWYRWKEIFLSFLPPQLLQEVVLLFSTNRVSQAFFQSCEFCCFAISSATSYEACVLCENFRQDASDVQKLLHSVGRILNLFWHEMPYYPRRFHRQSTERLYTTAISFFLNVDCKYKTIKCW